MKLENTREAYNYFTGKASDIVRQMGFAGIALIWIFKTGADGEQTIPQTLLFPAICIFIGLTFDLLQYVAGSLAWGIFNRIKEQTAGITEKKEFTAPQWINWATTSFFWLKIISLVIAYFSLIKFLYYRFS